MIKQGSKLELKAELHFEHNLLREILMAQADQGHCMFFQFLVTGQQIMAERVAQCGNAGDREELVS